MTFIGNIRGSFWPNMGVIGNFFRTFTDVSRKICSPKNGKKSTFQILNAYAAKTVEVMAKTI